MKTLISVIAAVVIIAIILIFATICKGNGRYRNNDEQEKAVKRK